MIDIRKWAYIARYLAENDLPIPKWLDKKLADHGLVCLDCYSMMGIRESMFDGLRYPYCSFCDGN